MIAPTRIGRYEVLRELGRGAMGTVYLARDSALGRLVALKTFRPGAPLPDPEDSMVLRRRMLREAQRAGTLSHPNVITIFDVVEAEGEEDDEDGAFFIVMEFVEGTGLDARLRQGPVPLADAVGIVGQIASALDHLHSRGIIHRDVKPANVLVTDDGRVKITDFGVARSADPSATLETEIYGTPHYMAPEQVRAGTVDARTDVFALGVLVYEMLTGTRPFLGATVAEVTHNILYGRLQAPNLRGAPLPEPLQEVLARALASDPAERYQTAGALADALRAVAARGAELEAAATKAMPMERWAELTGQAEPRQGSHALRTLAIAVVPALLLLVAALLYLRLQGGEETAAPVDEQARQVSYVRLLAEGKRLLASGDPAGAAVLFETAAGIVEDPTAARELRDDAERRMADDEARIRLEGARADLRAGRYDAALATAREMLEQEQGREKALEVLAEVQSALATAPTPGRAARPAPPARPGPTPPAQIAPLAPRPVPVPTPGRSHRSTLVVDLRSAVPEGVLTVWARDRELLRHDFAFYRREGLRRRPDVPGHWSRELVLSPGLLPVRVLVARSGEQARVRELQVDLQAGGRTVLGVSVPAEGMPVVELQ